MNDYLDIYSAIDNKNIDFSNYTLSILKEAGRLDLISPQILETIQLQIMDILKTKIIDYTHEESCSVKTEIAESLMSSILYCIDTYLLSLNSPGKCIAVLKAQSIDELYEKGTELIKAYVNNYSRILKELQHSSPNIDLYAYTDTIYSGLDEFFNDYDVDFFSHESPGSIDYPIAFDDTNSSGIRYIKHYIDTLNIENMFLQLFPIDQINEMLNNYGKMYKYDHKEMLINVFKLVFNNSLFSALLRKSATNLSITERECTFLQNNLSEEDLKNHVKAAIDNILSELNINDPKLKEYIRKYEVELCSVIKNYIANGTLSSLVITSHANNKNQNISFETNKKMDDDEFKKVAQEILLCDDALLKADIIKSHVKSLEDLMDILSADCIYDSEFKVIFDLLSDIELAYILYSISGITAYQTSIEAIIDPMHLTESEKCWQIAFSNYLSSLNKNRLQTIIDLSNSFSS